MILPLRFLGLLALPVLLLSACSSDGDEANGDDVFDDVVTVDQQAELTPIVTNSELVLGENRFAFGLADENNAIVIDAAAHLVFYYLGDGKEVLKSEMDAAVRVPARDAGIDEQIVHTHADGERHTHIAAAKDFGIYTAQVDFDVSGPWGVLIELDRDGVEGYEQSLTVRFNVLETGAVPNVGDAAPPSENLTAADVDDLTIIDTSSEPSAEMHTSTIAAAIAAGRPAVVLFAAPGYCTSALCGPEYQIMKKLFGQYREQAEFIHVEFYEDPANYAERVPVQAAKDWNLPTEPWFFVIDSSGVITARFEGPTSLQELEDALKPLLSS